MRWAIIHRPQDLPRSKHTLAEGKTLEEVITLSIDDPIGVFVVVPKKVRNIGSPVKYINLSIFVVATANIRNIIVGG